MRGDTLHGGDTRVKLISDSDEQKRSSVFQEKIGVTPSVSAPGDTNPSDATGQGKSATILRAIDTCRSECSIYDRTTNMVKLHQKENFNKCQTA